MGKKFERAFCIFRKLIYLCTHNSRRQKVSVEVFKQARVAQLVEHNLAKVGVASSNLVSRSIMALSKKGFIVFVKILALAIE